MNYVNDSVGSVEHTQIPIDTAKSVYEETIQYCSSSQPPPN